jgi:hypothetical protein
MTEPVDSDVIDSVPDSDDRMNRVRFGRDSGPAILSLPVWVTSAILRYGYRCKRWFHMSWSISSGVFGLALDRIRRSGNLNVHLTIWSLD